MRRSFLFLQGPHGPFIAALAARLQAAGHRCARIGFNGGDAAEWRGEGFHACRGGVAELPELLDRLLPDVTDVVLYGDYRPVHRVAAEAARAAGCRLHFLEEGYLRPHWITYERSGVNGNSPLMDLSLEEIVARAARLTRPDRAAPDQWGAMLGHMRHGLTYHARIALAARAWPEAPEHREIGAARERRTVLTALADLPARRLRRRFRERALMRTGAPYHVVLLQLGHDASVQAHSPYSGMAPFVADVARAFAESAPAHHHLVFKAHPFEDGRENLPREIRAAARRHALSDRVHFLEGEPLARLLDGAQSAVTVNSTAAQQALWRGLPVRTFGRAVYAKPGLVSDQPLTAFFAAPEPPDHAAYLAFRRYLLATSQIKGSFYTRGGREAVLRRLVDAILAESDPYEATERGAGVTDRPFLQLATGRGR
ncbi:capsule biosynthesis protein [Pontivivens ytuae]|uniref:Capsule biosynthesis protein CapA n=1 Tax=Pontivivens ytuae TaxID=2789856 RepID=A0A7S9LS40_9RHOB|nr:capsule biosynthesis protein CapA [Pontivivens ytuae]QPH54279.1 capsule biosynthesis protein CapA [Pontivivens ytuae]